MTLAALLLALAADSANPYLAQAKVLHQALEFERCLKRLDQAGRWENTHAQLAEIELYQGLCTYGLGNEAIALEHFEMGLKLDATLELPPALGPKVNALFGRARVKVTPKLEPAPAPAPQPAPLPAPP